MPRVHHQHRASRRRARPVTLVSGRDRHSGGPSSWRDRWRGLWGRGDSKIDPRREVELAQQLWVGNENDDREATPACTVCRGRVSGWQAWLADLPLAGADDVESGSAYPASALPTYCVRHLRLLIGHPEGRAHLRRVLPAGLAAAHATLRGPSAAEAAPAPAAACPGCVAEADAETKTVHAAAQLPPHGSTTLPGLTRLELCHPHTLQVAARIVGRLGPEPRAIPDLHMLLSAHRRRLWHLVARDNSRAEQLGRALVVVCDADTPLNQDALTDQAAPRDRAVPRDEEIINDTSAAADVNVANVDAEVDLVQRPSHRCSVCTAAATEARMLLDKATQRMVADPHAKHGDDHPALTLCRDHQRDLLNHARLDGETDDVAVVSAIARAQLAHLAPVLHWLDTGFGHPHTIRHGVAELAAPRPCPACAIYREGERHASVDLAVMGAVTGSVATTTAAGLTSVCLRHSRHLPVEHPARHALDDTLHAAAAHLEERTPALHLVSAPGHDNPAEAAPTTAPGPSARAAAPAGNHAVASGPLVYGLGLLNGALHHDTTGACDDHED